MNLAFVTKILQLVCCIFFLCFTSASKAQGQVNLSELTSQAVGKQVRYFLEDEKQPLNLTKAKAIFDRGDVITSTGDSVSLGIGVRPVWLSFYVNNDGMTDAQYRLSVETPWLDYIDTWLVQGNKVHKQVSGGDAIPFYERPMQYRFYAFETDFPQGVTQVFMRVETRGPLAIPVRLSTVDEAQAGDIGAAYQYGILYGIMGSLALYNMILFFMIRRREYGLYALYLTGFVLNSLSYTGQLHTVITADLGVYFQDWLDNFLMLTYSVAGLHFARILLNTKYYAPKLNTLVVWVATAIPAAIVVCFIFDWLVLSLILAFILNSSFALLFVVLGYYALKAKVPPAPLFLISSVTAATCIGISTMAVGGVLPYNSFTFKAIEVGMTFEAMFLAMILARQFRIVQQEKEIAEKFARLDALTGLNNRRGFEEKAEFLWRSAERTSKPLSLILLDIDNFKQVNDKYGHAHGDLVLTSLADCLQKQLRRSDLIARWGGEEFIVLLPECSLECAKVQAERLRREIEQLDISYEDEATQITASFGLVSKALITGNIEVMTKQADIALYSAKNNGRNRVSEYQLEENQEIGLVTE